MNKQTITHRPENRTITDLVNLHEDGLLNLAKSIYLLVQERRQDRRRTDRSGDDARLNDAAWQLLTSHMEREERLFETLTATVARSSEGVRELLVRQEGVARILDGTQHSQRKLADSLGALAERIRERV